MILTLFLVAFAVETENTGSSDELQSLVQKQQEMEDSIKSAISGENGIEAHQANISSILQQVRKKFLGFVIQSHEVFSGRSRKRIRQILVHKRCCLPPRSHLCGPPRVMCTLLT